MFIALALTLCTMGENADNQCNTYFVDTFTQQEVNDQREDCKGRKVSEMILMSKAKKEGRLPSYLKLYNIQEDASDINTVSFECMPLDDIDTP